MYCPRPGSTSKTQNNATPGKKRVYAPPPRDEGCNASSSTVVTDPNSGGSTSNTVYVPGPAGPAGANGTDGKDGLSFFWRGDWGTGASYETATLSDATDRIYDVVYKNGSSYICIQDHIADGMNEPQDDDFVGPTTWTEYWHLLAKRGEGTLAPADKDFFDTLKDDIFDWVKNASVGDLIAAGLAVAGVIWAGSQIVSMFTDDGSGDGEADQRYDGSDGYVTTAYDAPDIKEVLTSLCEYTGVPYDVSALPDAPCEFTIGNATGTRSILGSLALAYQFDMVDTGGVLKFVPRSVTSVKTIDDDDLAFASDASKLAPPYSTQRFQGTDLPKRVVLQYYDSSLDYDVFTQESDLFVYEEGQEVSLQVPVTLTAARAKEITDLTLINSHLDRSQYTFSTSYKHIDLEPADVISSPSMGLLRIKQISETEEGILEIIATDAGGELAVEGSGNSPSLPPASTNIPISIGYSQGLFIDPPALDDQDTGVRMYAAVHGYDRAGWPGAAIFVSTNGGASYDQIASTTREATVGLVETAIPSADYHVWDNTTVITVKVKTNTLGSVSELDVLNGKNLCMVGQEVIGFKNAVLTAPKTYQLSGLLRGRRGSEQFVGTHVANELFVLLDDAVVRLDYSDSDRGTTKMYKVVTIGSSIDKVTGQDVFMYSNNTQMWPVLGAKVVKTGADYTLSWKESVRFNNQLKDFTTATHDSDWGGYGIVVYDTDGTTVKKTYTTQSESWTYSASMQVNDFGSTQSSIKTKVVELSTKFGAGYSVTVNS